MKFLENLTELRNYSNIILIDQLNAKSKKFIESYENKSDLIILRQSSLSNEEIKYIEKKNINLRIFSWQNFNKNLYLMWFSHHIAFKQMDNFYSLLNNYNKKQMNFLKQLYNDQNVNYAFQKYIIDESQDYYDIYIIQKILLKFNPNVKCYIYNKINSIIYTMDKKNRNKNIFLYYNKNVSLKNG